MTAGSYWGKTFIGFFQTLVNNMVLGLSGKYHFADLAADEVQLITLSLLGIAAAIIGSFLVIRKMAMVANAISHTVLLGIVGSFLILHFLFARPFAELLHVDMKLLVLAAVISSILTMAFTDFFHHTLKLGRDSSIGLVFTSLFSAGIILVTIFTKNIHIGAEIIMGNVDMLHPDDIWTALALVLFNFACVILFFKEYLVTSFDPEFAKLSRISPTIINYIVIFQTSLTLVGAFRAVGVILVLALLVVPPVTARLFVSRLKQVIYLSALISFCAAILAVALTRHSLSVYNVSLSTSGMMVAILFVIWCGSLVIKRGYLRSKQYVE